MDMNIPADYKPTEADKTQAENRQELARLLAKTHLPMVLSRLVEKLDRPVCHTQTAHRHGGLSVPRQRIVSQTGKTRSQYRVQHPDRPAWSEQRDHHRGAPVEKTEEDKVLDVVPTYVSDLVLNLEDMDFSED